MYTYTDRSSSMLNVLYSDLQTLYLRLKYYGIACRFFFLLFFWLRFFCVFLFFLLLCIEAFNHVFVKERKKEKVHKCFSTLLNKSAYFKMKNNSKSNNTRPHPRMTRARSYIHIYTGYETNHSI